MGPEKVAEALENGNLEIKVGDKAYSLNDDYVSVDYSMNIEGVEMEMEELSTPLGKILLLLQKETA